MSDELIDEVEAINSIYGEDSLVLADDAGEDAPVAKSTYILKLPGDASSLRLQFPENYPYSPPAVQGTHHSSGGVRGAGSRDLNLFRDALGTVWMEGVVCLFDAVEEFGRLLAEEKEQEDNVPKPEEDAGEEESEDAAGDDAVSPEWMLSEPLVENKSTFVAHVARVRSPSQAKQYVRQLLASDRRIRDATHNITAWRIRGADGTGTSFQDCDDDGETAAGGRLLHLMQVMEVWDAMVVVTRWYGGVKLGPRRFAVINAVARDGFVKAGLVDDGGKERKKKG